jgi:hypothetical protein
MINESNYLVRSISSNKILIASPQLNHGGLVHVQIMRATMPSASTYMQLNSIAIIARHLSLLNQAVRCTTVSNITQ